MLRWRRGRAEDLLDAESVARIKRQDTAITLVRNALRYVVFIIVVLFILSIFVRNPLPATAGATLIAAIIGFGAQSFLRDVIAGFSIIFEGQYSVGDFIEVQPQNVSGIVEELGLRMTKIRSLSGEVSFIPNGMMQGVTNYVLGQQMQGSQLALNFLSLAKEGRGVDPLHALLDLYADRGDPSLARNVHSIVRIDSRPVIERLQIDGPMCFGRGTEVTLHVDQSVLAGQSSLLLSALLSRLFARHAGINGFVRTRTRLLQKQEDVPWPMTPGNRYLI